MKNIDFMKKHKLLFIVSLLSIASAFIAFFTVGFDYGIDFKGGVTTELKFEQSVDSEHVKKLLKKDFSEISVYKAGASDTIVIETPASGDYKNAGMKILNKVKGEAKWKNTTLLKNEFIGPKVGTELKTNGILALLVVLISVLLYTSIRFEFKFAVGAIFALVHDIVVTMGVVSITGIDVNLTVLAAILALLGYSLNDTIVVYDRIRENFEKLSEKSVYDIINISLNETLSRTMMTSITTAATLVSILFFAGESLHSFAIVLLLGVVFGTYSSVYIASNVLLVFKINKDQFKKEVVDKENGII